MVEHEDAVRETDDDGDDVRLAHVVGLIDGDVEIEMVSDGVTLDDADFEPVTVATIEGESDAVGDDDRDMEGLGDSVEEMDVEMLCDMQFDAVNDAVMDAHAVIEDVTVED